MAFIEDYALIGDCEQRTEPRTLTGSAVERSLK